MPDPIRTNIGPDQQDAAHDIARDHARRVAEAFADVGVDAEVARLLLDVNSTDASRALDMLRRVRLFAEEMRGAGLDVRIGGSLTVTVRTPTKPEAAPDA